MSDPKEREPSRFEMFYGIGILLVICVAFAVMSGLIQAGFDSILQ